MKSRRNHTPAQCQETEQLLVAELDSKHDTPRAAYLDAQRFVLQVRARSVVIERPLCTHPLRVEGVVLIEPGASKGFGESVTQSVAES